jgi:thiamine-monophosphate kinase
MKTETCEHKLIDWIRSVAGGSYIGDDCAVLPGQSLITSDTLVEGTHFLRTLTALSDLGWKAVAVNLSDIAAMAGRPRQLLVNLTLPPDFSFPDFRRLYRSIVDCAGQYRTEIAGGDLTRGPVLSLTLTVLGEAHERGCLLRAGAREGDLVIVSGDFGASAAGLWLLQSGVPGFMHPRRCHLRPCPRFGDAWELVEHSGGRGSLMDASDGLADALVQISRASQVGMAVDLNCVPVHPETLEVAKLAGVNYIDWVLYGGEDYELVGTVSASVWQNLGLSGRHRFTVIGKVTAGSAVTLSNGCQRQIDLSQSFQHWPD